MWWKTKKKTHLTDKSVGIEKNKVKLKGLKVGWSSQKLKC